MISHCFVIQFDQFFWKINKLSKSSFGLFRHRAPCHPVLPSLDKLMDPQLITGHVIWGGGGGGLGGGVRGGGRGVMSPQWVCLAQVGFKIGRQ